MLLQRLCEYSERLDLAPPMYLKTPIRWLIDLDIDGNLLGFVVTQGKGGKLDRGKEFLAPHVGRSSGVRAKLLADNAEYVLGLPRPKSKKTRVVACHKAFVETVKKCAEATQEPTVQAVGAFLEKSKYASYKVPKDLEPSDIVTFRVNGCLPIELDSVKRYWAADASPDAELKQASRVSSRCLMQCLICGQLRPPVRRLPFKIKRIPGGQPSGMALISANVPAFESYGLEASLIAPTCQECGERFSKAVNALIEGENTHITVGPTVYIFWTKEESGFNPAALLSRPEPDEVRALIVSAFEGEEAATRADTTPFYAVALSASAGRVAVRDWLDTTVAQAQRNLARFFALQQIAERQGGEGRPFGLYALAASTVRDASKELPPNVPQALLHVALKGGALPMGLFFQAVKRNRAEQGITRNRAALIKMVLLSQRLEWKPEDSMTQLDASNKNPAYLCGRLLAVLEGVQRAAVPGLNATITDRFFGTASSAPASVFARLLRGAQPHLGKLRKTRRGTYEALQRRLEAILADLPSFPRTLSMEDQGIFSLGYYHQRAADRAAAIAHQQAREKGEASAETREDQDEQTGFFNGGKEHE